ncbi:hypothetical protein [Nannocystis pusilla]|uniref:hypothetical protein n=1 Tax=Nannocystis pusilla TaxID=889268 RepID=UPI003DA5DEC1
MARARQRAEFARLVEVLRPVEWQDEARCVEAWVLRLRELPDEEGAQLARNLLRAYRHGLLAPDRWAELTGAPPQRASDIDDAVRRLWDAFAAAELAKPYRTEENVGRVRAGLARRWAWQPRWYLMSQDEDLLLMSDALVPTLLAVAAEPRVPKRQYLLEIVAHHARDSCCQAAYHGQQLAATLRRAAGWAPQAREVGAPEPRGVPRAPRQPCGPRTGRSRRRRAAPARPRPLPRAAAQRPRPARGRRRLGGLAHPLGA